ncbi:hypothetical protein [sulfur-oxidizing endosymbiont of Gigantopelta aegis]
MASLENVKGIGQKHWKKIKPTFSFEPLHLEKSHFFL